MNAFASQGAGWNGLLLRGIKIELADELRFVAVSPAADVQVKVESVLWEFGSAWAVAFGVETSTPTSGSLIGVEIPLEELPTPVLAAMNQTARQ